MDINKIKAQLAKDRVCFVTNSTTLPSTLLVSSLKTYINYIPIQNLWIIPGIRNGEPFYGLNAFMQMLQYMLITNYFDYVIYIDEDCFITDFEELINVFNTFKTDNMFCVAGPQDGGAICHRNHSRYMINTFLSFWNIKLLRNKNISFDMIVNYVDDKFKNHPNDMYKEFIIKLKEDKSLYEFFNVSSKIMIDTLSTYREKNILTENNEVPYCKIIRDDPNNPIEPHQIPYTYESDDTLNNFEPYYVLEQALITLTKTPVYYLAATDLYSNDNVQYDTSGITSVILNIKSEKKIAVHTWYSRAYTKWPTTQQQLDHTKRINTIIREFSSL